MTYKALPAMGMWSSELTPQRAGHFPEDILQRIEAATGQNPIGRQMGNIVGELRRYQEFALVDEVRECVDAYNKWAEEFNIRGEYVATIKYKLTKYRGDEAYTYAYEGVFGDGIMSTFDEYEGEPDRAMSAFAHEYQRGKRR